MLKLLTIKNYALIKDLHMQPSDQLNIITGETGAGKSIMLGAVGLLLGNRADTKVLMNEEEKCIVEGQFNLSKYELKSIFEIEDLDYDDACIIRREISPTGKSRAFVNDTPVTLDVLKKLGTFIMDIHSQHETLLLADSGFQMRILDAYADNRQILKTYQTAYKHYKKLHKQLTQLRENADQLKGEADYHRFLFEELQKANFQADEQDELEASLDRLEHAEEIKVKLNENIQLLDHEEFGALIRLQQVANHTNSLSKYGKEFESLNERIQSALIELKDINDEHIRQEEQIEFDPQKAEETKNRLSLLYSLQQKHKVSSIAELLKIQKELDSKLQDLDSSDEAIEKLEQAVEQQLKEVMQVGRQLSERRNSVRPLIIQELESLLHSLGMPDAKIAIELQSCAPSQSGLEEAQILFSANKGIAPQNLKQVASGGEFSRLMFCFKYVLADKTALPTIVFDEIDSGISGEIAIKMAGMMKQMAQNHQVISISHLPQIAAKGNAHFFVYKDNSAQKAASKIKQLSSEERTLAIAEMIGGENPGEAALASARDLLNH